LSFDGDEAVVHIPDSDSLSLGNKDYTIAAWIYPKSIADKQGIVAKVKSKGNKEYALSITQSKLRFDSERNGNNGFAESIRNVIKANCRQHVAVTFRSQDTRVTFYVDGLRRTTEVDNMKELPNKLDDDLHIGRWGGQYDTFGFKGLIDDVRIYDRVLDGNELVTIWASRAYDSQIMEAPDRLTQLAFEGLSRFGNWGGDHGVKTRHADEIAGLLLVIAKAAQARNFAINQVLDYYYNIVEHFSDSPQAVEALWRIVVLDGAKGLECADGLLAEQTSPEKAVSFYAALTQHFISASDHKNLEKYATRFIDRYAGQKDGQGLVARLIAAIGPVERCQELDKVIIERTFLQTRNPQFCAVVLRHRTRQLPAERRDQLYDLAGWIDAEFAQTELAGYARIVMADRQYRQGAYLPALRQFEPDLFDNNRAEAETIKQIDRTLSFYSEKTFLIHGIDRGAIYRDLAQHALSRKRSVVAVHCYKKSADHDGFDLATFVKAASPETKISNSSADNELWFWKGLSAADAADWPAALDAYERFLENDHTSILAARAYYGVAHAKIALGRDPKQAIAKAKTISPSKPLLLLEARHNNRISDRTGED
jgi:tetratricopeptide (TPR) repeat protein